MNLRRFSLFPVADVIINYIDMEVRWPLMSLF